MVSNVGISAELPLAFAFLCDRGFWIFFACHANFKCNFFYKINLFFFLQSTKSGLRRTQKNALSPKAFVGGCSRSTWKFVTKTWKEKKSEKLGRIFFLLRSALFAFLKSTLDAVFSGCTQWRKRKIERE
jgi:hypothetical protein